MIKKILIGIFLIFIIWFFIETPTATKEFIKFSGEKTIKIKNSITGNSIDNLKDLEKLEVSAGVEANITNLRH